MATERERFAKIESRAREADNALQQLNGYIALLKKKSSECSFIFKLKKGLYYQ